MKNTNITIIKEQQKAVTVSFITLVIMAILGPFLCLGVGWIFGFITKIIVGDWCITAINSLLGTTFTKEMLPNIAAALCWLSGVFRIKIR